MSTAARGESYPAAPEAAPAARFAPAGAAGPAPLGATLLVVLSAACFGSVSIFTALAQRGGATLPTTLAVRYLTGSLLLAIAAGGLGALRLPRAHALRLAVVGGGGQCVVSFLALLPLVRYGVPAATLGFLFFTFPAWVTLFAALSGREPITRRRLVALALSLAGIVVMVGSPRAPSLHPVGLTIALAAAVAYALYIPVLGRLQAGTTPAAASAWVTAAAGVIYVAAGLVTGQLDFDVAPLAWAAIAGLAVVCTLLAFVTFLKGLARLGAVRTAIVSTVEPFFTALLGAALLGQPIGPTTVVGGALIAVAVVVLQR